MHFIISQKERTHRLNFRPLAKTNPMKVQTGPLWLLLLIAAWSCQPAEQEGTPSRQQLVEQKAQDFFDTFAERTDWEKLCSFYREDMVFQDITLQLHLDSLWKFKRFYRWDEEGDQFQKLSPDQKHLSIYSLVADEEVAVARGRVNPFYYGGTLIDVEWGMEFTIWLYFDEDLNIIKQIDWMEYDPNALESMLQRCKENGFEAIPDWLDLSKRD